MKTAQSMLDLTSPGARERAAASPRWSLLFRFLGITAVGAIIGSFGSLDAPSLYPTLAKPVWAPPAAAFGPAWTILYILMAVAAWLAVRHRGREEARPLVAIFVVQLIANALWSWLFFAWRMGAAAFVEALVLFALVATMLAAFARSRALAAVLVVPYLLWVGFASALTYAVWRANPSVF